MIIKVKKPERKLVIVSFRLSIALLFSFTGYFSLTHLLRDPLLLL